MIEIRRAEDSDFGGIWEIFHEVVKTGDTYLYDPDTTREQAYAIWMSKDLSTYVAVQDGQIVGTYILRANHADLGSHVANAGYMVKRDANGKGIGAALCEHSMEEARRQGFLAMQFNMVVSTNERAVALWQRMGFSIFGRLPKVFRHSRLGLVDAFVMHRFL
ncbi:MAG: GNAT family N-acetyltransferase [Thermoanaerobaculia bacterium]